MISASAHAFNRPSAIYVVLEAEQWEEASLGA